ncbi:uncharacterized protein BDZ99DRAFT_532422, partial [Mytilinidion resinicola]
STPRSLSSPFQGSLPSSRPAHASSHAPSHGSRPCFRARELEFQPCQAPLQAASLSVPGTPPSSTPGDVSRPSLLFILQSAASLLRKFLQAHRHIPPPSTDRSRASAPAPAPLASHNTTHPGLKHRQLTTSLPRDISLDPSQNLLFAHFRPLGLELRCVLRAVPADDRTQGTTTPYYDDAVYGSRKTPFLSCLATPRRLVRSLKIGLPIFARSASAVRLSYAAWRISSQSCRLLCGFFSPR